LGSTGNFHSELSYNKTVVVVVVVEVDVEVVVVVVQAQLLLIFTKISSNVSPGSIPILAR
jgi:hypothetical protein